MFTVINGNMLEELDKMEENSVGSIVTDPPYEINFMGKDWDNAGVAFSVETWKKCLRVLKPGGYLLSFAAPRTQHRISCAIEDAGFEIRDAIMWLYGSGFPKSMDISKQLDKRGANNTSTICDIIHSRRVELGLTLKDIDDYVGTNGMALHWENGRRGITPENFNKLIKLLKIDADEVFSACRDIVGQVEKTESYRYKNNNVYQTNGNEEKVLLDITVPKTDLAKQWEGYGTSLKPAYEPIIVARKPLCGTVADNVMTYGVGGINIDECRISHNEPIKLTNRKDRSGVIFTEENTGKSSYLNKDNHIASANPSGRFPSNVILTYDDSDYDEVCGGFPDSGSGNGGTPYNYSGKEYHNKDTSMFNGDKPQAPSNYNDSGSASRYFYCAKASKRDRDEGLDDLPTKQTVGGGGGIGDYAEDVNSCSGKFGSEKAPHKNYHPCVKPTSLMQYLVRLVTPKGETILDPFMGSGSTGKAVAYENNDRDADYSFIGIELNKEYCDIAERRIEFARKDKTPLVECKQQKVQSDQTQKLQNKLF